jgi:hypothetical protein
VTRASGRPVRGSWPFAPIFDDDPLAWIESSSEPSARWLLLTGIRRLPESDAAVADARRAVLEDPSTSDLVDRLPDWEAGAPLSGHESPRFAPNLLNLLADMGVRSGDFARLDRLLDRLLAHQDASGRFQTFAPPRGGLAASWGSLLCDSHAIVETLVRYGHGDDPRVRAGVACILADMADTAQGRAWPCRPDPETGFRGPGRKGDACPQVTVEALRAMGRLPDLAEHPELAAAARVLLARWRDRAVSKPYMFGHGKGFKTVKWPPTWYRVDAVLDAVSRFPHVWGRSSDQAADRQAVTELLACLLDYNVDRAGRVTPASTFTGFQGFTFGQKRAPSAFATARLLSILQPFAELAVDVQGIDVAALTSSRGGTGIALPPRAAHVR